MSALILGGIVLSAVALLWAFDSPREHLHDLLYLNDESERYITIGLPVALLCCFLWLGYILIKNQGTQQVALFDQKVSRGIVAASVVRGEVRTDAGAILADAMAKIGQDEARTDNHGVFELSLSSHPLPETLVRISHDGYITRFFRYDDPIITERHSIGLQPKIRLIVLERGASDGASQSDALKMLRSSLEANLKCNEIEILATPEIRDDVLRQLAEYQRERALYDAAMVQNIGKFHGASHAVFYRITKKEEGRWYLESVLVNLATTKVMATSNLSFSDRDELAVVANIVAAHLLADLTTVTILSPKGGSHWERQVRVEGFVAYLPAAWKLCLTLEPHGLSAHFPQEQPTINDDGSWFGSEVYLGEPEPLSHPLTFRINAMVTHGEQSIVIATYLSNRQSGGLRREALKSGEYKILDHIDILRDR